MLTNMVAYRNLRLEMSYDQLESENLDYKMIHKRQRLYVFANGLVEEWWKLVGQMYDKGWQKVSPSRLEWKGCGIWAGMRDENW